MLQLLKLKNFRQHIDTELEFVAGVNTIVGLNNSGKSTIPEAIEFAMFGSRALRDSAKGYVTDGESDGSSVLRLELGSDSFTVGRNSKNAEVRKNGKLDARYKDHVSTYMSHVTGVNQTGFRLGHYVRQKELAAFSSLRPGKRFETIERMLKINAVDKAIKKIKGQLSELDTEQRILLGSYQDIHQLEVELDNIKIAQTSLTERKGSLVKDLASISSLLHDQRELQKKLLQKPELDRLKLELISCNKTEVDLIKLEEQSKALGEVSMEVYDAIKAEVDVLKGLEFNSKLMKKKKEELDKLNPIQPAEVTSPIFPDNSTILRLSFITDTAKQALNSFEEFDIDADCPTCHRAISKELYEHIRRYLHATLEEAKEALEDSQANGKKEMAKYDALVAVYKIYQKELSEFNRVLLKREQLLEDYIETNFNPEEKIKLEAKLVELMAAREEQVKLREQITSCVKVVNTKETLQTKIASLDYLKNLSYDPELNDIVIENEKIEHELNIELNTVSSELARAEGQQLELNHLVSRMMNIRANISSQYIKIAKYKSMQENFVLFKRHLTAKIRPLLQSVAEALFHKTTKDRYASYDLSSDYEITLTTHKGFVRKLSTISGSENDLACLCLRLAIATLRSTKLAGSLGFIILDEISGSFDDARTKQTLEGLLELRDVIPQIINITHKPVEMKYADKIFTVKEVNGVATVS